MTKERGGGLIFLAAGIYGLIFSSPLPLGRWNEPGPGVFPLVLSVLLCLSGMAWFIQGREKGKGREAVRWGEVLRKFTTPLKIVGLTAAFILTLEQIGYLLTSTLYLLVLFLWVSRYRVGPALFLAAAFGVGSWFFFGRLLATPLPAGLLPF
jgi:putative tricarboxylic transport membrane protein